MADKILRENEVTLQLQGFGEEPENEDSKKLSKSKKKISVSTKEIRSSKDLVPNSRIFNSLIHSKGRGVRSASTEEVEYETLAISVLNLVGDIPPKRGMYLTLFAGDMKKKTTIEYPIKQTDQTAVTTWNQTLVVVLPDQIADCDELIISLWDHHFLHPDAIAGEIRLNLLNLIGTPWIDEKYVMMNGDNPVATIHFHIENPKLVDSQRQFTITRRERILSQAIICPEEPEATVLQNNDKFEQFLIQDTVGKSNPNLHQLAFFRGEKVQPNVSSTEESPYGYGGMPEEIEKEQENKKKKQKKINLVEKEQLLSLEEIMHTGETNDKVTVLLENDNVIKKKTKLHKKNSTKMKKNNRKKKTSEFIEASLSSTNSDSVSEQEEENFILKDENDSVCVDWNLRFQNIIQSIRCFTPNTKRDVQITAYEELIKLSQDFLFSAKMYGKRIITEIYLPEEQKTIQANIESGGFLGGRKYIVNNILFKFGVDSDKSSLLPDDDSLFKIAGHELKGCISYFDCNIQSLCVPLQCLVDYLGFRLIAIALLPINSDTLVYGSSDSGKTVFNKSSKFAKNMEKTAQILNLKRHACGVNQNDFDVLSSACDIEGHIGTDQKLYLVDFSRAMPPDKPSTKIQNSHLFRLFRPEFVKAYSKPLCPDAFSGFISGPNAIIHNTEIREASKYLKLVVITKFANDFIAKIAENAQQKKSNVQFGSSNYGEKLKLIRVTEELHREGINMRYLGHVVACFRKRFSMTNSSEPESKSAIQDSIILFFVEMLARVIKRNLKFFLREKMKSLKDSVNLQKLKPMDVNVTLTEKLKECRYLTTDYLNLVFGSSEKSKKYWNNNLKKDLKEKFPKSISNEEMAKSSFSLNIMMENFSDSTLSGKQFLFFRLQKMMGIVLNPEIQKEVQRSDNIFGQEEPFDSACIQEESARVKHMNIVEEALGYLYMTRAKYVRASDCSLAIQYFNLAIEKFENVLDENSNNRKVLINCATCLILLDQEITRKEYSQLTSASAVGSFDEFKSSSPLRISTDGKLTEKKRKKNTKFSGTTGVQDSVNIERAKNYILRALKVDTQDTEVLRSYADFHYRQENYKEAEQWHLRALEANPNNTQCLKDYANLLQNHFSETTAAEEFLFRASRILSYSTVLTQLLKKAIKIDSLPNSKFSVVTEDQINEQKKELQKRISKLNDGQIYNLVEREISQDEDCQFHSILAQMWMTDMDVPELRKRVVSWLEENPNFKSESGKTLKEFVYPTVWEDYCSKMLTTWEIISR